MEAEFLFKSQFDKSLKLLVGGIIFAFSIQPLFLASCPRALLPPDPWVYKIPKTVVSNFFKEYYLLRCPKFIGFVIVNFGIRAGYNFLPLRENILSLGENFLPLRGNILPSRECFYQ